MCVCTREKGREGEKRWKKKREMYVPDSGPSAFISPMSVLNELSL